MSKTKVLERNHRELNPSNVASTATTVTRSRRLGFSDRRKLEHIKGKPHHVRKRIAFASATFATALIALVWLLGSYATGAFAIQGSSFAASTGQNNVITTANDSGSQGLAGAGAAAVLQASAPVRIEIIDAPAPASPKSQSGQTVLPF